MDMQMLAGNIRRLRNAKKMSQKGLAEAAGLSLAAIKKLELSKNEPRMKTVQAIAVALDVKLGELFLPVRPMSHVRFRSTKRMQTRENILAQVSRWLDDFAQLESGLNDHVPFALRELRGQYSDGGERDIVELAAKCRKKLDLRSTEPIHNICGLLENAGVKVKQISSASNSFFGLSVAEKDGGPAVIVNTQSRIPVERQIFSAAHELGHLLLHLDAFDVGQTAENKREEKEADVFAGHFLLPQEGFLKEWDDAAGLHWIDRLLKVKRIFHVSYKTVLFRLIESGIANQSIWAKFAQDYRRRTGRKLPFKEEPMALDPSEPFGLKPFDFQEGRFNRLVRKAVESDFISLSRGAEMLGIGVRDMRDILANWESNL